jgi:hypothetical protein
MAMKGTGSDSPGRVLAALEAQALALGELLQGMQAGRTAFVAMRADALAAADAGLTAAAARAAAAEQACRAAARELAAELRAPAAARISDLLPRLAPGERPRLRAAADRVRDAARAVRAEARVGARLLLLSRRVHDGILDRLFAPDGTVRAYDARAHAVRGEHARGALVSGTA